MSKLNLNQLKEEIINEFVRIFPGRETHIIYNKPGTGNNADILLMFGEEDVIMGTIGISLMAMKNKKRFEVVKRIPLNEFNKDLCLYIHDAGETEKIRDAIGLFARVDLSEMIILSRAPELMSDEVFQNYDTVENKYGETHIYHGLYKISDIKTSEYKSDLFYMVQLTKENFDLINNTLSLEDSGYLLNPYYEIMKC